MTNQYFSEMFSTFIINNPYIILIAIWSLVWKLIALWKSARNGHLTMFIVIAFVNTIGILEIGYLIYLKYKKPKN